VFLLVCPLEGVFEEFTDGAFSSSELVELVDQLPFALIVPYR